MNPFLSQDSNNLRCRILLMLTTCPSARQEHMGGRGGGGCTAPLILNSTLNRRERSASRPSHLALWGEKKPPASIEQEAWRPYRGSELSREQKRRNFCRESTQGPSVFQAIALSPAPVASQNNGTKNISLSFLIIFNLLSNISSVTPPDYSLEA
jgi:hypothetical protein